MLYVKRDVLLFFWLNFVFDAIDFKVRALILFVV